MNFLILFFSLLVLVGCSTADTTGSSSNREYVTTIENTGTLIINMPVQASSTASSTQDTENDPKASFDADAALAQQGGQASLAAEGASMMLEGLEAIFDVWNGNNNPTPEVKPPEKPPETTIDVKPVVVVPAEPEDTENTDAETALLEYGDYRGRSDDRPFWNFSKKMSEYPDTFTLVVEECYEKTIENNGTRWQSADGSESYVVKQSDLGGWNTAVIGAQSCHSEKAYFIGRE